MLEVLARCPVAAPLKACLGEEAEAEVVVVYLVGKVPRAVTIGLGGGGLNKTGAVGTILVIGVVERVDVNSQPTGMFRQFGAARNGTVAEARRIVVAHLGLVIRIIDIGQKHALDGVLGIEQLAQDGTDAVGNLTYSSNCRVHHLSNAD